MSEHNSEESTISKYKNLDIELENAINLANESMQTVGERLLFVYNLARQKGYNPFEARDIVETRIINVSPQYVRRMLPEEAKHIEKRHKNDEKLVSHTKKPQITKPISEENIVTISLDIDECREIKHSSIINGIKFKYDLNNKKVVKWI